MQTARRQMSDALTPSFSFVLSPPRLLLICLWIWATSGHRLLGRRKSHKSVGLCRPILHGRIHSHARGWGGEGSRRLAPAGSSPTLCSGSSMATCVSRARGTEIVAIVCIQWSVFCYGLAREQLLHHNFPKEKKTKKQWSQSLFDVFGLVFGVKINCRKL